MTQDGLHSSSGRLFRQCFHIVTPTSTLIKELIVFLEPHREKISFKPSRIGHCNICNTEKAYGCQIWNDFHKM